MTGVLRANHELAFSYRRSVGGADRYFLSGLARAEIWGSRDAVGRVTVPPVDWDPETGAPVEEFVRVGDQGAVRSWTWVSDPEPGHPLDRPFAWALVQLDGADTSLLHAVDVTEEGEMQTGMTVRADWQRQRIGSILDIRTFVPAGTGAPRPPIARVDSAERAHGAEVVSDVHLQYTYEPGVTLSAFFAGLSERRIRGGRCPGCSGVYVPPHATCPACRAGPMDPVDLDDRGTITSYTVVHVPFHDMTIDLPFVCAWIRLDGADVSFAHLLGETSTEQVAVGRRVQAVWAADGDLSPTWESIRYFRLLPAGGQVTATW